LHHQVFLFHPNQIFSRNKHTFTPKDALSNPQKT
jgi:hypothetical protein